MRMLVTGGAGFIGSNLVDRLLADGHDVVAVDDLSRGTLENLADARRANEQRTGSFSFARFDVTEPAFADLVANERPDVIHHLAAQVDVRVSVDDPIEDARLNVLGTINVLEAARRSGVGKVVFTSSGGSIYGEPSRLPVSERVSVDPFSPYAAAKASAELYLNAYRHMYDLRSTSLALGNVYGPRQDPHGEAGVVAIFATAMLEGRQTRIFGDGSSTRDYVFVDDVVDAFARAVTAGDGRRFNVGTGVETNVRELHRLVAETLGAPDAPELAPPRVGELQSIALDCGAARQALGWEPFTDLRSGLAATVEWIRGKVAPPAAR